MSHTTASAGPQNPAEQEALASMLANLSAESARWASFENHDEVDCLPATGAETAAVLGAIAAGLAALSMLGMVVAKAIIAAWGG